GGTLSGTINGGTGSVLFGNNVFTTWNVTGQNSGNIPGQVGAFNHIQDLIGGNQGNTFNFIGNASITDEIVGGSLAKTNRIDYFLDSNPITVKMSDITNGVGAGFNSATIAGANAGNQNSAFVDINSLRGNDLGYLQVPNNKVSMI